MSCETNRYAIIERLFESRRKFERFAMLYIRTPQHAQDIVMESFVYVLEHSAELDGGRNPESYLLSVIKGKCIDYLRHQQVKREAEANMLSDAQWELEMSIATLQAFDPDWLYDDDLQRRFRKALDELPETTRSVFLMSRIDSKSYAEIASEMGVSVKTVEYRISSALRLLRERFGDIYLILVIFAVDYHSTLA